MSAIATPAGASIGSRYQFFPSKESICSALLMSYMHDLAARLDQWKVALLDTPMAFADGLITIVYDYISERPACRVMAETRSLVPESFGMEKLSTSVRNLLSSFAPSMKETELSTIAITASFIVRAAVQESRIVSANYGASLRWEIQEALGSY